MSEELVRSTIRMSTATHEKLKELAKKEKRSLNNYLLYVLEKHVEDQEAKNQ